MKTRIRQVMSSIVAGSAALLLALGAEISFGAEAKTPSPGPSPTPGIEDLLKQIESKDEKESGEARIGLVRMGKPAAPRILQDLPAASPGKAYDLIIILDYFQYPEAADTYKKLWSEGEDLKVRLAAAMALCHLDQDYLTYQDFIAKFAKEGDESTRLPAMQMLGYIRDARAVPVLKAIFYDASQPDKVRQAALWDLSHTPLPESAQVLVEIAQDPEVDWFYKEITVAALKRMAGEKDMAPLISRLLEKAQRLPSRAIPTPAAKK